MGLLNNSGDIIMDAVLTDTGRMRLAKGDGSFRISKFALGDDEINYGLYDKDNLSGSAYYDITILQTPVLEAFTNNTSLLKSKLMSVNRNNILFLPVLKLYTTTGLGSAKHSSGAFVVPVDKTTVDNLGTLGAGILNGYDPAASVSHIRVDQGIDSPQRSRESTLPTDLTETQYIVEIDSRFGSIFPPPSSPRSVNTALNANTTTPAATPSFIDDDGIASYSFSMRAATGGGYVSNLPGTAASAIEGPTGTKLELRVGASLNLRTSTFLFNEVGSLASTPFSNSPPGNDLAAGQWRYIDTTLRITGVNTGYRLDAPIRFIKSV